MQPPRQWLTPALLALLLDRTGRWVRRTEIDAHLQTRDWRCALAELSNEQGYRILTAATDTLATPSHVNLVDKVPGTEFPSDMDCSLKHRLSRPGKLLCKVCARIAGDPHPYWIPGKVRLHARFKTKPERGRGQVRDNVEALCSVCRLAGAFVKTEKLSLAELQEQLAQADESVRQQIRSWLNKEYPMHS